MSTSFIILVCMLCASYSIQFDEGTDAELDYNLENLLSRRNLGDQYFDSLLQKYRQVRDSLDNNKAEKVPFERQDTVTMSVTMPGVTPVKHDSYFCISKAIPADLNAFIVGYEPLAEMHTAHHMLLFGCEKPLHPEGKIWPCGEMQGVCGYGGQRIMYAWGRNAPRLKLPKDVGFQVGRSSRVKYLTLQVHYGEVEQFKNGKKDFSGVGLDLTTKNLSKRGGIYLLADGWSSIPPHEKKWHIETGCFYGDRPVLRTFAYRVHAHKLGVVVTGYRVRNNKWTLIGKGDPQRPQAFYPSADVDIRTGDKLVARCTYDSTKRNTVTHIGATMMDEMCNFYIMYYYSAKENLYPPGESCSMGELLTRSSLFSAFPKGSDTPLGGPRPMERKRDVERQELQEAEVDASPKAVIHEEIVDWPSEDLQVGQVTGVALDDKGRVVIFHRGPNAWDAGTFDTNNVLSKDVSKIIVNTVLYLDPKTGKVLNELSWGGNMFYLPHGLTIDHNGDVWLTDVGAHQVFKFGKRGVKPSLVLGEAKVPGNDNKHFCKPTDVAVDRSGFFYVSDGYCNERVMVFMPNGRLTDIITPRKPVVPAPHNFAIPHSLALDEKSQELYVADRENGRVLVYDVLKLKFLRELKDQFDGPVYAITVRDGVLHAVTGASERDGAKGLCIEQRTGKVISTWKPRKGFKRPHDLVSSKKNKEIYVVEIGPDVVHKFERKN